jgi:hypothetical protein
MSDNNTLKLVRVEFSDEEWQTLSANPEFRDAVERAETSSEAHGLIILGGMLLEKSQASRGRVSSALPKSMRVCVRTMLRGGPE